jgi:hypothetical protein
MPKTSRVAGVKSRADSPPLPGPIVPARLPSPPRHPPARKGTRRRTVMNWTGGVRTFPHHGGQRLGRFQTACHPTPRRSLAPSASTSTSTRRSQRACIGYRLSVRTRTLRQSHMGPPRHIGAAGISDTTLGNRGSRAPRRRRACRRPGRGDRKRARRAAASLGVGSLPLCRLSSAVWASEPAAPRHVGIS